VAYSASIGGLGTLVGSPPNAIAAAQLGMDFFTWMQYGVPMVIVLMPVMVGVMYLMLRPNLNHKFALELEHLEWNSKRVIAMGIFLLTVVCWIFSSFI
ncbi:Anion transporter, partial [Enterobacter hormaechei]|nr:Anion transporter [Enterobacter hormaechei]